MSLESIAKARSAHGERRAKIAAGVRGESADDKTVSGNEKSVAAEIDSERFNIAIVKNEDALEKRARDMANEAMTEDVDVTRPWYKQLWRKFWRHNVAKEYYEQKEFEAAKEQIVENGGLFGGSAEAKEAQTKMEAAIVGRFLSEHEEVIHKEIGEERSKATDAVEVSVKDHLGTYLKATYGKDETVRSTQQNSFKESMRRTIYDALSKDGGSLTEEDVKAGLQHASNYLEVAEQMRNALDAQEFALGRLDAEVAEMLGKTDIVVGEAKTGVRTELVKSKYEKFAATKLGTLLEGIAPPTVLAGAVALNTAIVNIAAHKLAFAAGGALGIGAVQGAREYRRLKHEWTQHQRESAVGGVGEWKEGDRRYEFEKFGKLTAETTLDAAGKIADFRALQAGLEEAEVTDIAKARSLEQLAEINHIIELGDRDRVDLIRFSDVESVEAERYELDIARAKLRVKLEELYGSEFDSKLQEQADLYAEKRNPAKAIAERDKSFQSWRRSEALSAGVKAGILSFGLGAAVAGVIEGGKYAYASLSGPSAGPTVPTAFSGMTLNLPAGINLNPSTGLVTLPDGSSFTAEAVDNKLSGDTLARFQEAGYPMLSVDEVSVCETEPVPVTAAEAVADPSAGFEEVQRVRWYDNNTPAPNFDRNELGLHWGGLNGTGIDADGNYVYDISNMTAGGSFHGAHSPDVIAEAKAGNIKLYLSLSADTQGSVVAVDVEVITDPATGKERIVAVIDDPDIKTMFFENSGDGDPFTGKFAEIGHVVGETADGKDQIAIFATDTGPGKDSVSVMRESVCDTTSYKFGEKTEADFQWDPFLLPFVPRTPLERMKAAEQKRELEKKNNEDKEGGEKKENIEAQLEEVKKLRKQVGIEVLNHPVLLTEKRKLNRETRLGLVLAANGLRGLYRNEPYKFSGSLKNKIESAEKFSGDLTTEELTTEENLLKSYSSAIRTGTEQLAAPNVKSEDEEDKEESEKKLSPEELEGEKENIITNALQKNGLALTFSGPPGKTPTPAATERMNRALLRINESNRNFQLMKENANTFSAMKGRDLEALMMGQLKGLSSDSLFSRSSYETKVGRYKSKLDAFNDALRNKVTEAIDSLSPEKRAEVLTDLLAPRMGGNNLPFTEALLRHSELAEAYRTTGAEDLRTKQRAFVNTEVVGFLRQVKDGTEETFATDKERDEYFEKLGLDVPETS